MSEPKTLGIPPANKGPLQVLQFHEGPWSAEVGLAADEISRYHGPNGGQATRHKALSFALKSFLSEIVTSAPPGPERSTAISRAREAKMWASSAIALEGKSVFERGQVQVMGGAPPSDMMEELLDAEIDKPEFP